MQELDGHGRGSTRAVLRSRPAASNVFANSAEEFAGTFQHAPAAVALHSIGHVGEVERDSIAGRGVLPLVAPRASPAFRFDTDGEVLTGRDVVRHRYLPTRRRSRGLPSPAAVARRASGRSSWYPASALPCP